MRPILLTEEDKNKLVEEFTQSLQNARLTDGKFSFSKAFKYDDKTAEKAIVLYSPNAYLKMLKLLTTFTTKEVAWHCLVNRTADNEFYVFDVLPYPQEVTGVTVDTDDEEYANFLQNLPFEKAQHMHMQCHSHVDMAVTPSGTDKTNQADIIKSARRKGFYIFQIWNKKLESHSTIYDFDNNILYENADVVTDVIDESGNLLNDFVKNAKDMVKIKTTTTGNYAGYGAYGGAVYSTAGQYYNAPAASGKTKTKQSKKETKKEKLPAGDDADQLSFYDDERDQDDYIPDRRSLREVYPQYFGTVR